MSRTKPYKRAYAGGTFDLFHHGHVALFKQIRDEVADELVVSLNTDAFAGRYKEPPVMTLLERGLVVDACRYVTQTIVNSGNEDSRPAVELSGADCIVHGNDWLGPSLQAQMCLSPGWLAERKIAMVYLPYTSGISTTDIKHRILCGVKGIRKISDASFIKA
jgi:glycerol-3-phosphate cytidylyltransferase